MFNASSSSIRPSLIINPIGLGEQETLPFSICRFRRCHRTGGLRGATVGCTRCGKGLDKAHAPTRCGRQPPLQHASAKAAYTRGARRTPTITSVCELYQLVEFVAARDVACGAAP